MSNIYEKNKKSKTRIKDILIRITLAGILFLFVYFISTFEPKFIPIDITMIKEILAVKKIPFP